MADETCHCGSGESFERCCGPFLAGTCAPETAQALMRSRYSAYVRENITYLKETLWPKYQNGFDEVATAKLGGRKPLDRTVGSSGREG